MMPTTSAAVLERRRTPTGRDHDIVDDHSVELEQARAGDLSRRQAGRPRGSETLTQLI